MAANFWESSHAKQWLFDRESLQKTHHEDLKILTPRELYKLDIFYNKVILSIGRRLNLRQQVLATALVYFKRFYTRNNYKDIDGCLVAITSVYLACKIEECPLNISKCLELGKQALEVDPGLLVNYSVQTVAEFEYYLLEDLNFHTIVFHPYRPLTQFYTDLKLESQVLQTGWGMVNDTYRSNLSLMYPPFMIALTIVYLTTLFIGDEALRLHVKDWFCNLNVDMLEIAVITQEIIDMYEVATSYVDKEIPPLLKRLNPELISPPLLAAMPETATPLATNTPDPRS
ncbi:cyclin-like protein [Polychytrium aggregatum]|uniref:cyclin-like protein n=1 Tax=Polychytrium aggregatum TaxID=110093 RepID=UPI0022FE3676|nr:cyclin-like protein [Polychytrium aggregatum]KAI9202748.1 cyclin-like protein [Polychytrium aggregatum]